MANEVEVFGMQRVPVKVDPNQVIKALLDDARGGNWGWIEEEDGKYYIMEEKHKINIKLSEVSKRDFEYYESLLNVENYLNNI